MTSHPRIGLCVVLGQLILGPNWLQLWKADPFLKAVQGLP